MATGTKKCKICGVEYPYCKTPSKPGVFRWQDVACCEEHGRQYLDKILASRGESEGSIPSPVTVAAPAEPAVVEVVEEPEVVEVEQVEQPVEEPVDESTTKRKKSRRKFLATEASVTETNE